MSCSHSKIETTTTSYNIIKDRDVATMSGVPLGDPFILYHDNLYYAYGTSSPNGIEVYTSQDMINWKKQDQLALDKKDSYADRWFWAPEIYYIKDKNKFYMYYSADEHICVATSDSPLGPFVQKNKQPMLEEKGIDNSLFIDDDGKAYLTYVKFDNANQIWVAELESDLETIRPATQKLCMKMSQAWEEVWPAVNEGPFIVKHKGKYYMTYSANHYESPSYGVGYAIADSPLGPWEKYENNPILQKPSSLVGVGHHAMFRDKKGDLKIVYHAHHSDKSVHPRAMYISGVKFSDDTVPIMQITKEIISPQLIK